MPILSICIPTYNRAKYLKKSLDSIVAQDIFQKTSDVEIIISDNCSTDNTKKVVYEFIEKYQDKIKYFCNARNLNDQNLGISLSKGTGEFLKTYNDTLLLDQNSLSEIVNFISSNLKNKPILFFLNNHKKEIKDKISNFDNPDDFISHISFYSTWIGGFGIWKEDFNRLQNFSRKADKKLPQTDAIFRLLDFKKQSCVLNIQFAEVQKINKGGYNIAKIFGENYLGILKDAIGKNIISTKTYRQEKKNILLQHINGYYFDIKNKHTFVKGNYWSHTKDYHYNLYYYLAFIGIFAKTTIQLFCDLFRSQKSQRKKVWKRLNKHNQVHLLDYTKISPQNMQKISVGNSSYGVIDPVFWNSENEELVIGNYVSIASGTRFLCGGNHEYKGLSTYPFKVMFFDEEIEATSKGSIVVEDDVWIGDSVIVLSGVTIGKGAIIGAGSVVSKDIPPYAIAIGNPTQIVKYRFSENVIKTLEKFDFANFSKEKIINKDILYTKLNDDNAEKIINKIYQ